MELSTSSRQRSWLVGVGEELRHKGDAEDRAVLVEFLKTCGQGAELDWKLDEPMYKWKGIHTDYNNGKVTKIKLRGMKLSGTIPASLETLKWLHVLDLRDNELEGNVNWATAVAKVDISGNKDVSPAPAYFALEDKPMTSFMSYVFVAVGMCMNLFDVISDALAAIAFYRLDKNIFAAQLCVVAYPILVMVLRPRFTLKERMMHLSFLAPVIEGIRALMTGVQSGMLREMRLLEGLMESTPGSVLQLYYLIHFPTNDEDFRTIMTALVAGVASATFTLTLSITVRDEDALLYGAREPKIVRGMIYCAQVLGNVIRYSAMFATIGAFGFAVGYWSASLRAVLFHKHITPLVVGVACTIGYIFYSTLVHHLPSVFDNFETVGLVPSFKTLASDSVVEPGFGHPSEKWAMGRFYWFRILTLAESLIAIGLIYGTNFSSEKVRDALAITLSVALFTQWTTQPVYHYGWVPYVDPIIVGLKKYIEPHLERLRCTMTSIFGGGAVAEDKEDGKPGAMDMVEKEKEEGSGEIVAGAANTGDQV